MKTHKFARKPFYVDAVRVSEANMVEVAQWCDGKIEVDYENGNHIKVEVHRPLNERQTQAYVGDWVLDAGTGFKVYTPKAFDKSFEKVKQLSKAQADEAGIKVPHEPRQTSVGAAMKRAETNQQAKEVPIDPAQVRMDDRALEKIELDEVEPPKSKADEEAEKLISEVLNKP